MNTPTASQRRVRACAFQNDFRGSGQVRHRHPVGFGEHPQHIVAGDRFALPQQRSEAPDPLVYDSSVALVGFLIALTSRLQRLGTALAMDLEVWERHLPSRNDGLDTTE